MHVPVLHCTDDSQQTVEKGHLQRFEDAPDTSAVHLQADIRLHRNI